MFHPEVENALKLLSAMTREQYLDAISAPRIDPTKQEKKFMMTKPFEDSDDSTSDESEEEDIENDEGDVGEARREELGAMQERGAEADIGF